MNPLIQSDIHPDADSLNAFVERLLPEPERVRIVGHLAECGRCREVVYLAQAAAEEENPAAQAVAGETRAARGGWLAGAFAKWRVAWIPAAALVAAGGVVVWVQLRPAPAPTQMAQLNTAAPVPPSAPSASASVRPATPPASGVVHLTEEHREKKISPKIAAAPPAEASHSARGVPLLAAGRPVLPSFQPPRPAEPGSETSAFAPAREVRPPSANTQTQALLKPSLPGPQWQGQLSRTRPQLSAPMIPNRPMAAASATAARPPAPNILPVHGVMATGGAQPAGAQAASLSPGPQALNGLAVFRAARNLKLPSGLNPVSSAVMLNRMVAVDSAGAVFLSHDAGVHWEPVLAQWSGKAIEVQAPRQALSVFQATPDASVSDKSTDPPQANSAVPAPPPPVGAETVPPTPLMLFRLVTDRHQTWISSDGRIWHER